VQAPESFSNRTRRARVTLAVCLAISLGGSIWAWLGGTGCESCGEAARLLGDVNLGLVGTAYYALLLVLALALGPRPVVAAGVLLAAGVHASLAVVLASERILCPPCVVIATGAWAAAGAVLWHDPASWRRAAVFTMAAIVLSNGGIAAVRRQAHEKVIEEARQVALQRLRERPALAPGRAEIILYTEEGCSHCRRLEEEVLPALRLDDDPKVHREYRPPEEVKTLPVVLVIGARNTLFVETPTVDDLRRALQLAKTGSGPAPERGVPVER
jgi:hypothetical protein